MSERPLAEDPEPSEPVPAGPLFVPVRPGTMGCTIRFFLTPLGDRTAVGFTSESQLTATLGPGHAWVRLAAPALRVLARPLGITTLTIDPTLTARAPSAAAIVATRNAQPWRDRDPQSAGALRLTASAALALFLTVLLG